MTIVHEEVPKMDLLASIVLWTSAKERFGIVRVFIDIRIRRSRVGINLRRIPSGSSTVTKDEDKPKGFTLRHVPYSSRFGYLRVRVVK